MLNSIFPTQNVHREIWNIFFSSTQFSCCLTNPCWSVKEEGITLSLVSLQLDISYSDTSLMRSVAGYLKEHRVVEGLNHSNVCPKTKLLSASPDTITSELDVFWGRMKNFHTMNSYHSSWQVRQNLLSFKWDHCVDWNHRGNICVTHVITLGYNPNIHRQINF